jgi:hypothetical protein
VLGEPATRASVVGGGSGSRRWELHGRARNLSLRGRCQKWEAASGVGTPGVLQRHAAWGDGPQWGQVLAAGSRDVGGGARGRRSERSLVSLECVCFGW